MIADRIHLVLFLAIAHPVIAYNTDVCCDLAKIDQVFINDPPPLANQTCGQTFSANIPAALELYVDYAFCSSRCGGIGRSNFNEPSEWAAPVVQFLLPSVIFSLSIPRERVIHIDYTHMLISKYKIENSFLQLLIFLFGFFIVLLPVLVDSVLWIIIVVVGAGNMIIGGLYEAVIDFRILKFVKKLDNSRLGMKQELLATLASGNLRLSPDAGDPKTKILASLYQPVDPEKSRSRLLNLIGAQSSFGGAIGSPVLFYLGAFVYTILDLQNNLSDEDSAISLSFGIEWMIIVHVAIVSGTLLAANNPSTSAGITGTKHEVMNRNPPRKPEGLAAWVGWSKTYDTGFQPVSIWDRGANKWKWIENTQAWKNRETATDFKAGMHFSFWSWLFIFIAAFFLIVIPPAAGGVVAYVTPPKGISCRSLSFVVYGSSQLFTTILATIRAGHPKQRWMRSYRFLLISSFFWFSSLLAVIGGTVMQISGVYRNCICYALAEHWVNIAKNNPRVQVANDTSKARQASTYWVVMGSIATIFMALNCYIGWWYQIYVRRGFTGAVKGMWVESGVPGIVVQQSGDPTPVVTQPSWGLPRVTGESFEMSIYNASEISERAPLVVRDGGGEADENRGWDLGSGSSADLNGLHAVPN